MVFSSEHSGAVHDEVLSVLTRWLTESEASYAAVRKGAEQAVSTFAGPEFVAYARKHNKRTGPNETQSVAATSPVKGTEPNG